MMWSAHILKGDQLRGQSFRAWSQTHAQRHQVGHLSLRQIWGCLGCQGPAFPHLNWILLSTQTSPCHVWRAREALKHSSADKESTLPEAGACSVLCILSFVSHPGSEMPWAFPTIQLKKHRLLEAETLWVGLILKPEFHPSEMNGVQK